MRHSLFVVLLISTNFVFAQDLAIDSLRDVLSGHSRQDSVFVNLLNELSFRTFKENPHQSLDYANKALVTAQVIGFQKGIGESKNNMAVYQLMRGNADASLEMALQAVRVAEENHLFELLAQCYATLGTVYHQLRDFDKALRYLDEADRINGRFRNIFITTKVLNSRGAIARDSQKYDSALYFYNKAITAMDAVGDEYRKAEVLNNIGITYARKDNSKLAMDFYLQSLSVSKRNHNQRAQALVLVNIGNLFLDKKEFSKAEKYFQQSMAMAKEVGDTKILSGNFMSMIQLKNETGNFDAAHLYSLEYYNLKDSLLTIERGNKIAELEIRYETQKKEHAIALLERDHKIHALWMNILMAVLVAVILLSLGTYLFHRERERKNRLILNLEIGRLISENTELSEKYKNVQQIGIQNTFIAVDQKLLKKSIAVIENHMSDPSFGVEMMARELGMSRTNMHRKIKAVTGFPPSELIRSIRLRKAAALLSNRTGSIAQISLLVGFEDHSYFSKSFKKQFGVTPSDYYNSAVSQITH